MITESKPLSIAEALEYLKEDTEKEIGLKKFVKKFTKMNPEKAKELRKRIEDLDLLKMKPEYIAKIIDVMPNGQESLNKIFNEISFDEDESNKILQILKEFK